MKTCQNCGFQNDDDARYCMKCGTEIKTAGKNRVTIFIGIIFILGVAILAGTVILTGKKAIQDSGIVMQPEDNLDQNNDSELNDAGEKNGSESEDYLVEDNEISSANLKDEIESEGWELYLVYNANQEAITPMEIFGDCTLYMNSLIFSDGKFELIMGTWTIEETDNVVTGTYECGTDSVVLYPYSGGEEFELFYQPQLNYFGEYRDTSTLEWTMKYQGIFDDQEEEYRLYFVHPSFYE